MRNLVTAITGTIRLILEIIIPIASIEQREQIAVQQAFLEDSFLAWNGKR